MGDLVYEVKNWCVVASSTMPFVTIATKIIKKSSEFFRFRGLLKRPLYELSILAGDHRIEL